MPEKKNVLVICHTSAGQMYMGVLLNRIWYKPVLVKTAEEGILYAKNTPFSLIMLDGDMPEQDRKAVLSLLRNDLAVRHLPLVVFVTGENAESCEALVAQGCSAVITKPIDVALVYAMLGRLCGQPRQTPRTQTRFRVEIEEQTPEKFLTCINLSEGGIYLRAHSPLPEGTLLHLKFTLPRDTEEIEVIGEVVRTEPLSAELLAEPGMGISFVKLSEETRIQFRNFVQWELIGDLEWESTI